MLSQSFFICISFLQLIFRCSCVPNQINSVGIFPGSFSSLSTFRLFEWTFLRTSSTLYQQFSFLGGNSPGPNQINSVGIFPGSFSSLSTFRLFEWTFLRTSSTLYQQFSFLGGNSPGLPQLLINNSPFWVEIPPGSFSSLSTIRLFGWSSFQIIVLFQNQFIWIWTPLICLLAPFWVEIPPGSFSSLSTIRLFGWSSFQIIVLFQNQFIWIWTPLICLLAHQSK